MAKSKTQLAQGNDEGLKTEAEAEAAAKAKEEFEAKVNAEVEARLAAKATVIQSAADKELEVRKKEIEAAVRQTDSAIAAKAEKFAADIKKGPLSSDEKEEMAELERRAKIGSIGEMPMPAEMVRLAALRIRNKES